MLGIVMGVLYSEIMAFKGEEIYNKKKKQAKEAGETFKPYYGYVRSFKDTVDEIHEKASKIKLNKKFKVEIVDTEAEKEEKPEATETEVVVDAEVKEEEAVVVEEVKEEEKIVDINEVKENKTQNK